MTTLISRRTLSRAIFILCGILAVLTTSVLGNSDPIRRLLADQAVVMLTDEPELIDWPLVLHLTYLGGAVDIVTAGEGLTFRLRLDTARFQPIRLIRATLPAKGQTFSLDSLVRLIRGRSYPRTVIVPSTVSPWIDSVQSRLRSIDSKLLGVAIYRPVDSITPKSADNVIVVSPRQFAQEHLEDYTLLAGDFGLPSMPDYPIYHFYQQVTTQPISSFLNQSDWRLSEYLNSIPSSTTVSHIARSLDSLMETLTETINRPLKLRAEALMTVRSKYLKLASEITASKELMADRGMRLYLSERTESFSRAVRAELGVSLLASLSPEITPLDTSMVYRLEVSNSGALPVAYQSISLIAGNRTIVLDSVSQELAPHGRLIRQFRLSDSLENIDGVHIIAKVMAGGEEMVVESDRRREPPGSLRISFDPPFLFVPPVARITDDRMASSHDWRIRIDKDPSTTGKAKLLFEPPRGLFAGAYRQEIELEEGLSTDWMTIPFSVTNLFELGTQNATLELQRGGKVVSADSGRIRIAECRIDKEGSIGFVPDTSGGLEDILRMTSATYEPLTDRTLTVGNLDAFRTIVIGSAANWHSPQVGKIRSRLEEFLKNGGVIVLFGQPSDWPSNALPLPFSPQPLRMSGAQALVRISDHHLLTTPYVISTDILLKGEPRERYVSAVLGGETTIVSAPNEQSLVAVAPYGGGKIVYCGLPLTTMISRLNIEAIHFFANLLNY